MAQEHNQSPPAADDFAPDFGQHLMSHEARAHYMPENYTIDQHNLIRSGTSSGYVTPDPNQMLEQHGMPYFDPYANQYEPGSMVGTVGFLGSNFVKAGPSADWHIGYVRPSTVLSARNPGVLSYSNQSIPCKLPRSAT